MWFLSNKKEERVRKLNIQERADFEKIKRYEVELYNLTKRLEEIIGMFWKKVKEVRGISVLDKIEVDRYGDMHILKEENAIDWNNAEINFRIDKINNPEIFEKRREIYNKLSKEAAKDLDKYLIALNDDLHRTQEKFYKRVLRDPKIDKNIN